MPHYLLRNWLLDSGLVLEDVTLINRDILSEILRIDRGEVRLCHKLEPKYLTVSGDDRQKVSPAKAVFSRTVLKQFLS